MDFGIIAGVNPPDSAQESPGVPPYKAFEGARYAMGDTLRYAEKVNLIKMEPHPDLSSTGFVLANPGEEYLILQPNNTADPFTVKLERGTYTVEWYSVKRRETNIDGQVSVDSVGDPKFLPPFDDGGPAVLYVKHAGEL